MHPSARAWRRPLPWEPLDALVLAVLAVAGLLLRFHDYTLAPAPRDNPDELEFAWQGLSLIQDGTSTTWSYFPEYHHVFTLITHDGTTWRMVTPWFDLPPLFGLLVGASSYAAGARHFVDVTAAGARVPPLLLGAACVPLAYLLGRRVLGRWPGALGAALLATGPAAVLFSRSVEIESLLAPLLLLALIATHRLVCGEGGRWTVAALLAACLVAGFAKQSGPIVAAVCGVVLAIEGRWRLAWATVGAGLAGLAAFAAYGASIDWSLFLSVQAEQGRQRTGVMNAFEFIADPAGLNRRLRDGWWLLGWIGVGALVVTPRRPAAALLAWPAIAYAAAMAVLTDERVMILGWYRISIYPLIYLAAGYLLYRVLRRPSPAGAVLVTIVGAAAAASGWFGGTSVAGVPPADFLAAAVAVVVVVLGLAAWRPRSTMAARVNRAVAVIILGAVLAADAATSWDLAANYLRL